MPKPAVGAVINDLLVDLPDIAVDFPKAYDFVGKLMAECNRHKLIDSNKQLLDSKVDDAVMQKVRKSMK